MLDNYQKPASSIQYPVSSISSIMVMPPNQMEASVVLFSWPGPIHIMYVEDLSEGSTPRYVRHRRTGKKTFLR